MKTVHKYPFEIQDDFVLDLPVGAKILTVQMQGKLLPCMWALVNPKQTGRSRRHFRLAGTGHEIDDAKIKAYIGTFQMSNGGLVFHLFEVSK